MKLSLLLSFLFLIQLECLSQKEINILTNRNIEVINAITIPLNQEMLQDSIKDPWMFDNTQVMRLAATYFKPNQNHIAVTRSKGLLDKLGAGIYLLALYYEDLPTVKRKMEIPEIIWREVNKNRDSAFLQMDNFMTAASDFYKDSKFEDFEKTYSSVYKKAIDEVKSNLPNKKFIGTLEHYYGDEKNSYNIIVMPFFKSKWGMGWETTTDGKKNIFNITSPFDKQVVDNQKVLQAGFANVNEIANLSIHEFGHSFVNTLTSTEPFLSEISKFNTLFKPINNFPQYSDWATLFNEHVVRAGEIIVMNQLGEKTFSENTKIAYRDWVYLNHFLTQLNIYINNRDKYPTFNAFLPVLIKSLSHVK